MGIPGPEHLLPGGDGRHGELVAIVPHDRAAIIDHADDLEMTAADLDLTAHRVGPAREQ